MVESGDNEFIEEVPAAISRSRSGMKTFNMLLRATQR